VEGSVGREAAFEAWKNSPRQVQWKLLFTFFFVSSQGSRHFPAWERAARLRHRHRTPGFRLPQMPNRPEKALFPLPWRVLRNEACLAAMYDVEARGTDRFPTQKPRGHHPLENSEWLDSLDQIVGQYSLRVFFFTPRLDSSHTWQQCLLVVILFFFRTR